MLKKTITYKNFNDEEVSEDYFFHLSKAELVELEMSHEGGLSEALAKIIQDENGKEIIAQMKSIILSSYGVRSADGKRFTKTQQLRDEFESTEAYSALFMELVTEANKAAEFVNGIVPQGLADDAAKVTGLAVAPELKAEPTIVNRAAMTEMSQEELQALARQLASGEVKLSDDDPTT